MNRQSFTFNGKRIVSAIHMPVTVEANGQKENITAVWDTGATSSCISKSVATKLGLKPIGKNTHHSASGCFECCDYIIDIYLLGTMKIPNVRVSDFAGGPGVDALIGMDIITLGDMALTNGGGKTMMSFRIPPDFYHIDYVTMQNKENTNKEALKRYKKALKKS